MIDDLRFMWRTHSRRPLSTTLIVAVLGLGLGAATAAFGVVDSVLLRPLPYGTPGSLVALWETSPSQGVSREPTSAANFVDWKNMNASLYAVAAYADWLPISNSESSDEQLIGSQVTPNLFDVLQIAPLVGRTFDDEDVRTGGQPVVMIAYNEWVRRFGRASLNGLELRLGGQAYRVIGVLPPSFRQPGLTPRGRPVQIWRPLAIRPNPKARRWDSLNVIARLKPTSSFEAARREFAVISTRLAKQYPEANGAFSIAVTPLREALDAQVRTPLLMLLAAVVILLVITWMNLANILAARSLEREAEFAIREALGASAWQRFRLLLVECLGLSLASAAVAVCVAIFTLRTFALQASRWVPGIEKAQVDVRVLLACLAVTVLVAPLFAVMSLAMVKMRANESLRGRGGSSRGVSRLRAALVTVEILLTVVLLTTGSALLREFMRLERAALGYDAENILTAQVQLPALAKPNDPRDARSGMFLRDLVANIERLPGVKMAAAIDMPPLVNRGADLEFIVEGLPQPRPDQIQSAEMHLVSPDYFRLSGMSLLKGRFFGSEDRLDAPQRVIVSRSCVARYFGGLDPIGRQLSLKVPTGQGPWRTVVGEVADVQYRTITTPALCQIYMPHEQEAWPSMALLIKTNVDPASLTPSLYKVIRSMDPTRPLYNIRTEEDLRSEALASRRFSLLLVLIVGGVSLLVALAGIYGIINFSVTRRTREVGLRIAVGARPKEIVFIFLRDSMVMALIALGGGLILTFAASKAIGRLVADVSTIDVTTCSAVCAAVFACVMLASYIPARRAAAIEPSAALRHD